MNLLDLKITVEMLRYGHNTPVSGFDKPFFAMQMCLGAVNVCFGTVSMCFRAVASCFFAVMHSLFALAQCFYGVRAYFFAFAQSFFVFEQCLATVLADRGAIKEFRRMSGKSEFARLRARELSSMREHGVRDGSRLSPFAGDRKASKLVFIIISAKSVARKRASVFPLFTTCSRM